MRNTKRYKQILDKQVQDATGPAVKQPKQKAQPVKKDAPKENPFVKRQKP